MKKYIILFTLLIASVAFGNASNLTRVTDADAKTFILRAGMTLDDFGGIAPMTSGNAYYVDSVNGADNRSGRSWDLPVATIDQAIDLIAAARTAGTEKGRSIIYVREQHNEGGSVADLFDVDIPGVTIWGLGTGADMPTIDFDAGATNCAVSGDNVTIHNIWFRPSAEDILIGLDIESGADYCTVSNCKFGYPETATDEFDVSINVATSTGTVIEGNLIEMGLNEADSGVWFIDSDHLIVRNNIIRGDFTEGCIYEALTPSGGKSEEILLKDNVLWNGGHGSLGTVATIGVDGATSGISINNKVVCNLATMHLAFFGPAMHNFDNYYSEKPGGHITAFSINLAAASTTEASIDMTPGQ